MDNNAAAISTVRYYMQKYNLFPKKKWGQNFLIDKNVIDKIITRCNISEQEYVVEIGPGLGALTQRLAVHSKGVLAIDIDTNLNQPLQESLKEQANVKILFADVMKINIEEQIKVLFQLANIYPYTVCANIPYYITSPIIFKLLENCAHMREAVLMIQKEVAQRLLASPGSKEYGVLTIMVNYYADVELLMNISPNCFYPRPDVSSSVIRIKPLPHPRVKVKEEQIFKGLIRAAFQQRRKTILNICNKFFSLEKDEINDKLKQLKIQPAARAENLSIQDFALLADSFIL